MSQIFDLMALGFGNVVAARFDFVPLAAFPERFVGGSLVQGRAPIRTHPALVLPLQLGGVSARRLTIPISKDKASGTTDADRRYAGSP